MGRACGRPTLLAAFAATAISAFVPVAARAAEVVVEAGPIPVKQGAVVRSELRVHATGAIDCLASRDNAATAVVDTSYSLVRGAPSSAGASEALRFFAGPPNSLLPPGQCPVAWDGSPAPYTVPINVAVAPNTPLGTYRLTVRARTGNPGGAVLAPLGDATPADVAVEVGPPPAPGELSFPRENVSVNLIPRGRVDIRYPGGGSYLTLPGPAQVPPGTRVDTSAAGASVLLVSDRTGAGAPQSGEFSQGVFDVYYTRQARPELGARSPLDSQPFTELLLADRAARGLSVAARKKRGLWGNGRGRFRTKGAYGAGTVRGTHWFTGDTSEGTLVRVRRGRVQVSDLVVRRRLTLGPKKSYLARPPSRRRGRTRG